MEGPTPPTATTLLASSAAVLSLRSTPPSDAPFVDDITVAGTPNLVAEIGINIPTDTNPTPLTGCDGDIPLVVLSERREVVALDALPLSAMGSTALLPQAPVIIPSLPSPFDQQPHTGNGTATMTITASASPAQLVISVSETDLSHLEAGTSRLSTIRSPRSLTCTITWKAVKITVALIAGIIAIVTGFLQVFRKS